MKSFAILLTIAHAVNGVVIHDGYDYECGFCSFESHEYHKPHFKLDSTKCRDFPNPKCDREKNGWYRKYEQDEVAHFEEPIDYWYYDNRKKKKKRYN